jgi:hypothetical protein
MEQLRTITREFATGEKAVLHLEARSGSVTVEGRASDSVVVEAVLHLWTDLAADADDAAELVERGIEQDQHRVIVRAPSLSRNREGWAALFGHHQASVDYHVRVPQRTAVRVLSRSGSVEIANIHGVVHSEALSGKITVADVRGNVSIISRSGSVAVERVAGSVEVDARSGKLRVREVNGNVSAESRSGTADIEGVDGDLRVMSRSGALNVDGVTGKLYARARAGSVRYRGRVLDDVDIEAHAGSIVFAVDPDFPFFIDAESHVGGVHSELPPRRNGAAPGGGPKVRLRTHAGSIRLVRW